MIRTAVNSAATVTLNNNLFIQFEFFLATMFNIHQGVLEGWRDFCCPCCRHASLTKVQNVMSQSEPFIALVQGGRFNCVLKKNSSLTLNITPQAVFLEQINGNAIKTCLKSSIHKLKFDVYHEARQTSQLFSPDRFVWRELKMVNVNIGKSKTTVLHTK